ncbi:TIGR03620 family F420-dependent LLM class oxidoreductase [Sphingobium sp. AN558]|uniref:TIGR03620 family F420-dependent LLM class oxidoreductase n=1 Tax=Sphingobium sp. AN558 TaxID=3133442 RepID=UPI0030BECC02
MKLGKLGVWVALDGPIGFFEDDQSAGLGRATAPRIASFAQRVEELGYAAIWLPDGFGRDSFIASALLLASTKDLVAATGISSIYSRDSVATAAAATALNEWSGGRFILGLGVSHAPAVEGMRGHDYTKPVSTMRAYLEGMTNAPYNAALPTEKTPVLLAALRGKMLELARDKADGAHPFNVTPQHTAQARDILGPGKLLCVEQKLILETDPAKARAIGRAELELYLGLDNYLNSWRAMGFSDDDFANGGSDHLIDSIIGWGDENALRKRIDQHFDAGADHVCFKPVGPDNGTDMRIVELLAPGR